MVDIVCPEGSWQMVPVTVASSVDYSFSAMIMFNNTITIRRERLGFLKQGDEDLYGNNSVENLQYSGSLTLCSGLIVPNSRKDTNGMPRYAYLVYKSAPVTAGPAFFPGQSFEFPSTVVKESYGTMIWDKGLEHGWTRTICSLSLVHSGSSCTITFNSHSEITGEVSGLHVGSTTKKTYNLTFQGAIARHDGNTVTSYRSGTLVAGSFTSKTLHTDRFLSALPACPVHFGELAATCAESLQKCDINMISFCREIPGLGPMVRSTAKLLLDLDNPKSWASLFLTVKYGWNMTIQDTSALLDGLYDSAIQATARVGSTHARVVSNNLGVSETDTYKILYSTRETPSSALRKCIDSGFWPTLTNMWDLVPFSFVVDWMTGIGRIFDSIDRGIYLSTLPCLCAMSARRLTGKVPLSNLPTGVVSGSLSYTYYIRAVSSTITLPPLHLGKTTTASHAVELTALVGQKKL